MPGVHTLELFRGIADTGMRHVLNRHEQAAVFAADGYARVTGSPGVALLISGPGVTNAATPIAQAYHDSIPLLVLSAVAPESPLGAALHELPDQHALMRTITAFSEHIDDPTALPDAIARAFELFRSGRPRPVHIQLPADLLRAPAPEWAAPPSPAERPAPDPAALRAAADVLASARSPMLLLGGGAVDAGPQAAALAERLQAPIALSLNAKGAVPDAHPLSLGTTLPTAAVLDAVRTADVVVAAGTEFCDVDYYYAPGELEIPGRLVRIDIDPAQLERTFRPAVALHADSAAAMAALAERIRPALHDGAARAAGIRERTRWWDRAEPLLEVIEAIGDALPRDAIVAADSTQLAYIGQHAWPAYRPRSWLIPSGWGTLGPALPMAIGAAIGAPGRPVLTVAGDGGLLYTIHELATAADLDLPLTLLLWNNDGYGEMRDEMDLAGIPHIGTEASARDYLAIARGFGWRAERATSLAHLQELLADAFAAGRPTLVEATPELA